MTTSCGEHVYVGITPYKVGEIRRRLAGEGATITGENPWDADMHSAGVVIHGVWEPATQILRVTITDKSWYASCSAVWSEVDKQLRDVQALAEPYNPPPSAPPPPKKAPPPPSTPGSPYPEAIPWEPPPYVAPPPEEPAPSASPLGALYLVGVVGVAGLVGLALGRVFPARRG